MTNTEDSSSPAEYVHSPAARRGVADLMRVMIAGDAAIAQKPADGASTVIFQPHQVTSHSLSKEGPGDCIGNYVLKNKLGGGGFGTVWRAEQTAPFRREVALKILKQGMDTEEVLARFEAERRTLAKMDHPHIAAVFDAGATERGRPFFAMELVSGPPITEYCDEHRLTVRERVELFIPVCQAVQHAHMKQVLHRDLKPTNILVAEVDGKPMPKVIDFGIAKVLAPDGEHLLETRLRTAADIVIGTFQYMSPEQAGAEQDIDTRSDVYTLGVILYEMLAGEPPLGRNELRKAAQEILQRIREAEPPPRPSTRWLSLSDEQRKNAASTRRTDPKRISQQIQGELDWIVLKALERDRTRRYSAAMDLAEDLSRYLRNEPVTAGPPSSGYRFKKLILRHKAAVVTSAVVLFAIIAGGGIALWQWHAAALARDEKTAAYELAENSRVLAVQREQEARLARDEEAKARALESEARKLADDQRRLAETERSQAQKERRIAQTARAEAEDLINYMLFDLRDKLEPLNRIGLLDEVARQSEAYFKAQPADGETDAQKRNRGGMWQNRGRIALALGRTEEAEHAFREFHRIMTERAQAKPADQGCLLDLAIADSRMSLVHEQRGRIEEAVTAALAEHEVVAKLAALAGADKAGLRRHLAATHERLGDLAKKMDDQQAAERHYEIGQRILCELQAHDSKDANSRRALATLNERLADLHLEAGRLPAALDHYQKEVAAFEELLADTSADATLRRALGVALQKQAGGLLRAGKTLEAQRTAQRALEVLQALAAADPGNQQALHELALAHEQAAEVFARLENHQSAAQHWREDLEISRSLAAADPANARWQSELAVGHWNLAQALLRQGSHAAVDEAASHFQAGHDLLDSLRQRQALDINGQSWLASFEKALAETSKLLR